ncbi:FAD-dependent oxidoreductase [Yersinia intermedia]|uniref:FAD-dependent oxidoreductase n=1 Tax=Yersinia intermedia TaxID=631 RepID=UPI0030CD5C76
MKNDNVIIAGAGPVGLVAALVLAQAGIKVQVLEKRTELNQASKASTFHPPTLTILARLGIFNAINAKARHVDRLQYRTTEQGILGHISYDLLQGITPHPFRKHLEQSLVTPLLLQQLRLSPYAEVFFDTEMLDVVDEGEQVTVHIQRHGRQEYLKARFLLGCDGAHSQVRQAAGISTSGESYPGHVLRVRADSSLETLLPDLAPVTYLVNDSHSASFLHMPDCWRIILRVPPEITLDTAHEDEWILQRLQGLLPKLKRLPEIIGKDSYGASKRIASHSQRGNILLAGDSLHLTNTRGGMNMNAGIHDAFHIARAMILAIQDHDLPGLARAAQDRHRIAKEMLLPRTDVLVAQEGSWIDRVQRLLENEEEAYRYLIQTAMLDMVDIPTQ